jgi:hypothetical protein
MTRNEVRIIRTKNMKQQEDQLRQAKEKLKQQEDLIRQQAVVQYYMTAYNVQMHVKMQVRNINAKYP